MWVEILPSQTRGGLHYSRKFLDTRSSCAHSLSWHLKNAVLVVLAVIVVFSVGRAFVWMCVGYAWPVSRRVMVMIGEVVKGWGCGAQDLMAPLPAVPTIACSPWCTCAACAADLASNWCRTDRASGAGFCDSLWRGRRGPGRASYRFEASDCVRSSTGARAEADCCCFGAAAACAAGSNVTCPRT
jgi:hypothetical protein